MEVLLVSEDGNLQSVCREVIGSVLGGQKWSLTVGEPAQTGADSDLYIWDFTDGCQFPQSLTTSEWRKHLILVHRDNLGQLRERGCPEVNVILKPFTVAALRAFLEQACCRWAEGASDKRVDELCADRDELLQCLIQANLKLQEYDQDRTNFLARAIHDFRAPLTALNGYCSLLIAHQLGPLRSEQREVIQRMLYSSRRLSRMADAMFKLSIRTRIDQQPVLQRNDIRECIEQALQEMLFLIEEKQIATSLNIVPPPEAMYFEREQIEQAVINILDNAYKFTPRNGSIDIRGYPFFWERHPAVAADAVVDRHMTNSYRIDISDSGPGIPASQLEQIFEEYTTYGGGQDRSGAGLGLAICKMVMIWHQGKVWAENRPTGAMFSIVLPFLSHGYGVEEDQITAGAVTVTG